MPGTHAIVALDVPTLDAAQKMVDLLGDECDFYKVGLELFSAEGPAAVRWVRAQGRQVFLDLKLHDIPNTVRGAASRAADLGASLLTVHGIGGPDMLDAAVSGAGTCGVLAVTVLTSLDDGALSAAHGRSVIVANEVMRIADMAALAGTRGVVCSGAETARVHARHPMLRTLVPGVRLRGDGAAGDQARVVTPGDAARAGASYVVLGRTVTAAQDPVAALKAAKLEMLSAG